MNQREHVLNAVLLSVGLGYLLRSSLLQPDSPPTDAVDTVKRLLTAILKIGVPIVVGTLIPDLDTTFGRHRKTLHNIGVLALFYVFPLYFQNLYHVWIGILAHYLLDLFGSKRGLALLYPFEREYRVPFGVRSSSKRASIVTVGITGVELASATVILHLGDLVALL